MSNAALTGKNGFIYYLICIFGVFQFILHGLNHYIVIYNNEQTLQKKLFYQEYHLKNLTWRNITDRIQIYRYISDYTRPPRERLKQRRKPSNQIPCQFPPKGLLGREEADLTYLELSTLELKFTPYEMGGHFRPDRCRAITKVAIIVPYRDRDTHLKLFLNNIIPRLTRQQIDFTIYIVEQSSGVSFNRGMMRNIGFKEASTIADYDCYIFNDVDTVPEDDRNFYFCETDYVRHLVTKLKRNEYGLPYAELAGGIIAFTKEQFLTVNGYSNQFFLWGGEDDDIFNRIKNNKLSLRRPPLLIGTTTTFTHKRDPVLKTRYDIMSRVENKENNDGVSTIKYERVFIEKRKLYTWIYVRVKETYEKVVNE